MLPLRHVSHFFLAADTRRIGLVEEGEAGKSTVKPPRCPRASTTDHQTSACTNRASAPPFNSPRPRDPDTHRANTYAQRLAPHDVGLLGRGSCFFRGGFRIEESSGRRRIEGERATWSSVLLGARKWKQKKKKSDSYFSACCKQSRRVSHAGRTTSEPFDAVSECMHMRTARGGRRT